MASALLSRQAKGVAARPATARVARCNKTVVAKLSKATKQTVVEPATVAVAAASSFMVWNPTNNKMFETFSYLPPLDNRAIAAQVEFIVDNGYVPCLEFSDADLAYTSSANCIRMGPVSAGYYDNRYWPMWKLPMFGCRDPAQVLKEIDACTRAFPNAYIRLVAFDSNRQVQCMGFLVHRPSNAKDWCPPEKRSVGDSGSSSGGGGRDAGRGRGRSSSYW